MRSYHRLTIHEWTREDGTCAGGIGHTAARGGQAQSGDVAQNSFGHTLIREDSDLKKAGARWDEPVLCPDGWSRRNLGQSTSCPGRAA